MTLGPISGMVLEALGVSFFLIFVAQATGLKSDGVTDGSPIQCQTGGGGESHGAGVLEALQAVTADLQPAASGRMIAEKQPTWTDAG